MNTDMIIALALAVCLVLAAWLLRNAGQKR